MKSVCLLVTLVTASVVADQAHPAQLLDHGSAHEAAQPEAEATALLNAARAGDLDLPKRGATWTIQIDNQLVATQLHRAFD